MTRSRRSLLFAACLLLLGCASSADEEARAARERRREEAQQRAVRRQWEQAVRDAEAGKQPPGVHAARRRAAGVAPLDSARMASAQQEWIELRLRAARSVLVCKEALMAWRYVVHQLRHGPVQGFALYERRQRDLGQALDRRESLMNLVSRALSDLEQVEDGDLTVVPVSPGAFPRSVQDGQMLDWVTGTDLPDGRYRIEAPLAHDPRLEDDFSRAAEARALAAQDEAVADRKAVLIPVPPPPPEPEPAPEE